MIKRAAPLKRSGAPHRSPRTEIVIVCEGKVTEPRYFKELRSQLKSLLIEITTIEACGVPLSVVQRAVSEKKKLERKLKKTGDSFDGEFEVWAVFDRDAHPKNQVPAAFDLARAHDVKIAFSNPCFEVWGLMHFACWSKPGHHHATQRDLKACLPDYCHETNPVFNVGVLMENYKVAVENAKKAAEMRVKEGLTEHGDPSTTVYKLTEKIRLNGKK